MVYTPDDRVWPILAELRDCLCNALRDEGLLPGDCFCGIVPGAEASHDYPNGMAWVRLATANPSTEFPSAAVFRNGCGAPLAFGVEVGAINCVPGLTASGTFPTKEALEEAARLQVTTMMSMRRVITCCLPSVLEVVLETYTPYGPNGALVGGTWTASISEEF